ncbi:MAG: 2-hydroxyglutaryl-CoA dehydratase [Desulfomonile tiedjei]|nr:2-hydroxyglutaryl-CoA dehydratase [Desulfomonile tiedjei]
MYYAGIDVGSLSTETVIIDDQGKTVSYDISSTGANSRVAGEKSFHKALEQAGISDADLKFTVVTGYGRISLPFANKAVTEITCHGRGAYHLFPGTRTVLDIGGQDSKVIRLADRGRVVDFAMNDKCAAGTGRFLEVMARALEIGLEEMGPLSMNSKEDISISSMCTVFAESEVISLVAQARPIEDILNALHEAICSRVFAMLELVGVAPEVTMTGGVAKNTGIAAKVRQRVGGSLNVPVEPQIVGALGAALIARDCAKGGS